jgi:hypothetical protein
MFGMYYLIKILHALSLTTITFLCLIASPFAVATCPFNLTGGAPRLTVDGVLLTRYTLSIRDTALSSGVTAAGGLPANIGSIIANTAAPLDLDGDGRFTTNDALITARTLAGFSGVDLINGLTFTQNAQRKTVTAIASFISAGCPVSTLNVFRTGAGSGTVTSSAPGVACGATCSANYSQGVALTLVAAPDNSSTFDGWGGACTGTGTCTVTLSQATAVTANFSPALTAGAPIVLYTDALSAPVSGGEGGNGAYLSIFGKNFGNPSGLGTATKVFIGNCEVANYRAMGAAKVGTKLGLQHLAVQVGSLCGAALGQAQPVKVVVGGVESNVDNTFTPVNGRVLFVSLNGNDTTAVAGDITKPWRYLQTTTRAGAYATLRAGDHIVIRGGNWNDLGFETTWMRFRDAAQMGSLPTSAVGTGWIHITAYPGPILGNAVEDVHYSTPSGSKGGIHGPASAYYATTGEYVSISNLRMDVSATANSDAAPINLQSSGGNWRIVNNELGPWPSTNPAPNNSKGAGVSGHGDNVKVLGNQIYGMACTGALENHGVYVDSGGSRWEIAYNWIHDITGGNLIQFFDNVGLAGNNYPGLPTNWQGFTGMQLHHNWMEGSGKYGINLAPGIISGNIWNNVITRATYAGLRIDTISKNMDMTVAFNTFYDNDRLASGSGNAQVLNTWGNYNPTGTIRIYNNIFSAGSGTTSGGSFYVNAGDSDGYLDFKRNLWSDNGHGWSSFSCSICAPDNVAVYGDPKFTNSTTADLTLQAISPALNKGTQVIPFTINNDFSVLVPRPVGGASDIGAFERQ